LDEYRDAMASEARAALAAQREPVTPAPEPAKAGPPKAPGKKVPAKKVPAKPPARPRR